MQECMCLHGPLLYIAAATCYTSQKLAQPPPPSLTAGRHVFRSPSAITASGTFESSAGHPPCPFKILIRRRRQALRALDALHGISVRLVGREQSPRRLIRPKIQPSSTRARALLRRWRRPAPVRRSLIEDTCVLGDDGPGRQANTTSDGFPRARPQMDQTRHAPEAKGDKIGRWLSALAVNNSKFGAARPQEGGHSGDGAKLDAAPPDDSGDGNGEQPTAPPSIWIPIHLEKNCIKKMSDFMHGYIGAVPFISVFLQFHCFLGIWLLYLLGYGFLSSRWSFYVLFLRLHDIECIFHWLNLDEYDM